MITNAKVTLSDTGTGFTRSVTTDARGEYQFVQLAPGTYRIVVEMAGFTTVTRTDVQLLVNTPTTLDLRMELGATTESVNVAAEVSTVNTVDASVGNAFSELQVRELPLETRNVVQLLSLEPGVTTNGEVLGARRDENNITLDGVDVNDNQNAGLVAQNTTTGTTYQGVNGNGANVNAGFNSVLPVPLDSVQEFRVTVGGQGVDQGRSSGGQVVLITKSGTNQLHVARSFTNTIATPRLRRIRGSIIRPACRCSNWSANFQFKAHRSADRSRKTGSSISSIGNSASITAVSLRCGPYPRRPSNKGFSRFN